MKHSPSPIAGEPWTVPILLVEKASYIEPDRSQDPPTVDYSLAGRSFSPFSQPAEMIREPTGEPSGFWLQPIAGHELDRPGVLIVRASRPSSAQWRDLYYVTAPADGSAPQAGSASAEAAIAKAAADAASAAGIIARWSAASASAGAHLARLNTGQPPPAALNLIRNGDFSAGLDQWRTYAKTTETGEADPILFSADPPAAKIYVATPNRLANAQLYQNKIELEPKAYRLRAQINNPNTQPIPLGIFLHEHAAPYTSLGLSLEEEIPPGRYTIDRVFMASASANARLRFWLVGMREDQQLEIGPVELVNALAQ